MGWNLPPGCTDKDIDDAAPQNEPEYEYEDRLNPSAPIPEPPLTPEQMRESNEAFYRREREYIEFHRRNLLPGDSLKEALERYRECGE